jgi:hypothetical protein
MTVNGLKLPDAFVALIDRPKPLGWWVAKGDPRRWIYRGGKDGVYWVPEGTPDHYNWLDDLRLIERVAWVEYQTNRLPDAFHIAEYTSEVIAKWDAVWGNRPGFIPLITDFSRIVQFGEDGESAAYCFDYRDNPDEPSIIHWNDGYWRRFAPNFDTLISWFEPLKG